MTELSTIFLISIGIGVGVALALIALHVGLWPKPWRLAAPANYTVGVSAIGIGVLITSLIIQDVTPFLVGFGVVAPGGLAIIIAYYIRGRLKGMEQGRGKRAALIGLVREENEDAPTRTNARNN